MDLAEFKSLLLYWQHSRACLAKPRTRTHSLHQLSNYVLFPVDLFIRLAEFGTVKNTAWRSSRVTFVVSTATTSYANCC